MRGVVLEAGLGFWRAGLVQSSAEASGFLVVPLVFKTSEPRAARLAGSIPVRLRCTFWGIDASRVPHSPGSGVRDPRSG
jgi:hypothetical protein